MIPIYTAEKNIPGLAEKIQANCSIAYCSKLIEVPKNEKLMGFLETQRAKASMVDVDLFYTKSVLVSTNWNKNDDVFDREEVWAARNTPSHKRTNINHDEKKIVGHITDVWPIDNEGNILAEDTTLDDLPDIFHLVNGSVIYRYWEDKDYKEAVAELIDNIKDGKKYVSMECLFNNFAYAIEKDKSFYIVERDKDTAFLTAHLKAYGGKGEYEGAKIGRMPRNIVFSGKGFVDKPANPNSIILSEDKDITTYSFASAKLNNIFQEKVGVINISASINKTEIETNMNEEQKKALEDSLASAQASVKELTGKLETAKASQEAEKKTVDAELATLKAQVADLTKSKETAEKALAEVNAKNIAIARASKLVAKGFAQEEADKKVILFANLTDEQFEAVAAEMKKDKKDPDDDAADDKKKKDKSKANDDNTDTKVLDTATPVATSVVVPVPAPSVNEAVAKTKAELRKAVASMLGYGETETQPTQSK